MGLPELKQELYSIFNVNGSVLALQQSGAVFLCVDSSYCVSVYDMENLTLQTSTVVSKDAQTPHRHSNACSISPNKLLCIPLIGNKEGLILQYDEKFKRRGQITEHESDIESSVFSPNGRYCVTGGQDGKVFIYDTERFLAIGSLIPRADYIYTLHFSKDSELLACGGFDKSVVVFDMVQNKRRCTIPTPDVVEEMSFCDNNQKLYMILRNGASFLYDVIKKETVSIENLFSMWPSALAISPDERFAVVGARGDSIYIVNLHSNMRMLEFKIELPGVSKIYFHNHLLFLGATDGNVFVIEYQKGEKELEEAVKNKKYRIARDMIENNLFLSIHPLMKVFDEDWPEILDKAIELLNNKQINEAVELVNPFIYDQTKAREFDFYLMQQEPVRKFAELTKNKEYIKAYDMTVTTKFLVNTFTYTELENAWNKAFMQAKKLLEENPTLNIKKADSILKPFESSVKKELIAQLLKNCSVFSQAENLIKARNFSGYFSLINQYGFLRDTELFKKVSILGDRNMAEMLALEQEGQFERAEELAKFLQVFPSLKRSCTERLIIIQQKRRLLTAIEIDNITQAYAIVEEYKILRSMPQFREFTQKFEIVFEKAKNHALSGHPKSTLQTFGEYVQIPFWIDRIASLLKTAYIHEIENKIHDGGINWTLTLHRFIERFGKDDMLQALVHKYGLEAELESINEEGNYVGYRTFKFVDEIVIFLLEKE